MSPVLTVGALVRGPAGKLLLVRTGKWSGLWGVPGGKVEYGESLSAALLREFSEEVGLELFDLELALIQEAIFDPEFYRPEHMILVNYLARASGEQVEPNSEILEWKWLGLAEALELPLNRVTRVLLDWYREHLG
jgi:ADP-ribose pyrophosphatase YjhB (NUDIX family)